MGISITKNTLARFQKKIEGADNIADSYAEMLITQALEIARAQYGDASELQDLRTEKVENGVYKLIAFGKQLAYLEFGTGTEGEASGYDTNKLPKEPLVFVSRGAQQETPGWQYNYYRKHHSDNPNIKDWKGFSAGKQMFNTAQELGRELGRITAEYVKTRRKGK